MILLFLRIAAKAPMIATPVTGFPRYQISWRQLPPNRRCSIFVFWCAHWLSVFASETFRPKGALARTNCHLLPFQFPWSTSTRWTWVHISSTSPVLVLYRSLGHLLLKFVHQRRKNPTECDVGEPE
ncbi:hypothetical protein BX666DRAFT_1901646 [Dichotomocladium elegans]|nr:hypothetical protein BX666DRAFT_1901646 [Dichotomocladium elegans]